MTRPALALLLLATLAAPPALAQAPAKPKADDLAARTARTRKLVETTRVSVSFQKATLDECLAFLHEVTGISLAVSPAARDAAKGRPVTLRLKRVTLKSALELVLGQVDEALRWSVSGEVLRIDVAGEAPEAVKLVLYDVSELDGRPSYPGPKLGLDGLTWDGLDDDGPWCIIGPVR